MSVEVRLLTVKDRQRVLEVSSQIWDGDDWVPEALDSWFDSDEGEAVAAVFDGRLIGFARRTWLLPEHAWFEALRADPAAQGRGAGRAITEYLIDSARRDGAKAIHLSTYVENKASIHIIESYGFRRVASFAYVEKNIPENTSDAPCDPEIVDVSEGDLIEFVDRSTFLALAQRRFPRGWKFVPFDLDPREATARLGTRIGIRRNGELVALLCLRQPPGGTSPTVVNFADGSPDDLRRLVAEAHRRYAGRRITVMVPVDGDREASLLPILREYEYTSWSNDSAAVFVYQLSLR
jgi:ribosomal protein S18 acetylase RimI-like enzyme